MPRLEALMRSPEARVSWVLGVEVRVARAFIEQVRSLLITSPSADEVALCLEEHPQMRAPLVLANQLADKAYGEKPPAQRGGQPREPKLRSGRREPRQPRRTWNDPHDARLDPFDPSRVPQGNVSRCPQGVPLTEVCRICSPEKLEMLGDAD